MSIEEAERFVMTVDNDKALSDRIMGSEANEATITTIIKAAGFDTTLAEIREVALEKNVLSEADLNKVAAGLTTGDKVGLGLLGVSAVAASAAIAAAI